MDKEPIGNRNLAAKWANNTIFIFYVSEVLTIVIRNYAFTVCGGVGTKGWIIFESLQLSINLVCMLITLVAYGNFLSLKATFVYAAIIAINIAQAVQSHITVMKLFVNLFGYLNLLEYWDAFRRNQETWFDSSNHQLAAAILHTVFTLTILVDSILVECICAPNKLDIIESIFELMLLGYLAAMIDI